ncbi:response regulator transcription factor [Faecalicatena orotica]|uniref:Heme response regulator HssR n=1 Tax=Faecalicatena orotica TaxID=1544 RepID=A0A2Y9BLQ9_9FIRM|nr:response regulator transcription factor [Faecalicatena orotica]PWJ23109.1 winged helix family two component transcriptional regulator [Faecalicatena orotica]SSA57845.1 two component transcriptional regulator, winged helix family [Faecalicatena orotica]
MATVLIVEDDKNTRLLTAARLKPYYTVLTACDGEEALDLFYKQHVDLIVADIMMPNMDGYELVRTLRSYHQDVPVIMLTAKDAFEDKRLGFSTGTDDYMTKPVNHEELLWRIEALLRRAKIHADKRIIIGAVTADSSNYTVSRADTADSIELPRKEFDLLFKLLSYPDVIFTKNQLLEDIWGYETDSDENTIKTHISRLRNKFDSWKEFQIVTVRGLGYKVTLSVSDKS